MSDNIRFDSVKLPKMTKTREGYLRGEAVVSRSGVFKYRNVDGSIRGELRHPDDIFKQDSLETLKMIPITNDHPPEFVHAGNVHRYQVGYTGEHYDIADDKVIVSMTVTHQDAIDAIQSGKLELSMGYNVILKPEEGVYEGASYDARQLEPKYNHLAIVKKGRAGSEARFRFDNACELVEPAESVEPEGIKTAQQQESSQESKKESKKSSINRIKNDFDMTLDMTKENTGRIDILTAENEQLAAKISNLQLRLDAAEKSCETVKGELEKEKALKTDSVIESKVMDRVMLLSKAAPFLGEIKDCYRKTDREIMEMVISLVHTDAIDIDFKNYSDDYVKGVFEASVSTARQHMDANNNVYSVVMNSRNTDGGSSYDINRAIAESLKDRKGIILNSGESK